MNVYRIADLTLGLTPGNAEGLQFQKELEDFYIGEQETDPDAVDIFMECRFLWDDILPETPVLETPLLSVYEQKDSFYVIYNYHELVFAYLLYKNSNRTIIYINQFFFENRETYHVKLEKHDGIPAEEITYSGGELLLYTIRDAFFYHAAKFGRIAIHSSAIIYQERVWIFSAAAGVGKTTHVMQWEKAGIPFEMFNGDVVMCYVREGAAYAAGLPWSGTSDQYVSRDIPLGGIFFLERGKQDETVVLSNAAAALAFMGRGLSPNWTRELKSCNMQTIGRIVPNIACAKLICTPTENAALAAKTFTDSIKSDIFVDKCNQNL